MAQLSDAVQNLIKAFAEIRMVASDVRVQNLLKTISEIGVAPSEAVRNLIKAFSECGHGMDEKSLITHLAKWNEDDKISFWKLKHPRFKEDPRSFYRLDGEFVKLLRKEFLRFKVAVVMRTMHPWERDARLIKKALKKKSQSLSVFVEIACTRSSEELLGARRAYHSLFDLSIEEDVVYNVNSCERKLLVALASAYRYDGSNVNKDTADSEATTLATAINNAGTKSLLENDEVIWILTIRGKAHLNQVYKQYKTISGNNLDEDLRAELRLKETVQCLCAPQKYFTMVLDAALKKNADNKTKKALTRVIVTQADTNIKQIREEFKNQYGVALSKKIEDTTSGNYRDFLIALVTREN